MATGIVSAAAHALEVPLVPGALFALNLAAYPALLAAMLARLLRHPAAVLRDMADHAAGPTFLAMVAATAVLERTAGRLGRLRPHGWAEVSVDG